MGSRGLVVFAYNNTNRWGNWQPRRKSTWNSLINKRETVMRDRERKWVIPPAASSPKSASGVFHPLQVGLNRAPSTDALQSSTRGIWSSSSLFPLWIYVYNCVRTTRIPFKRSRMCGRTVNEIIRSNIECVSRIIRKASAVSRRSVPPLFWKVNELQSRFTNDTREVCCRHVTPKLSLDWKWLKKNVGGGGW